MSEQHHERGSADAPARPRPLAGRTVVLAGATSAIGVSLTQHLVSSGARVIATARSAERLRACTAAGGHAVVADATSLEAMTELAEELGRVDAVLPLVGGWRGGGGLRGQSDADFAALLPALNAARATSRAFETALLAAEAGRFAVVSSTAVARPLAGGANYVAVKAATEAWTRAVAHAFARSAREAEEAPRAAAVILRAATLRAEDLAAAVRGLWDQDAATLNGRIIELEHDREARVNR